MAITRLGGANAISGTLPAANINDTSIGNITALPAAISTGKVLQVVQAITTTAVTHVSDGAQVDTGLTASITPSATSSKVLVLISQNNKVTRTSAVALMNYQLRLFRDSTNIEFWENVCAMPINTADSLYGSNHAYHYEDSPSSTSSLTYKTTGRIVSSGGGRTVKFQDGSAPSTITLMEIAG
jgi:hypothetical protein